MLGVVRIFPDDDRVVCQGLVEAVQTRQDPGPVVSQDRFLQAVLVRSVLAIQPLDTFIHEPKGVVRFAQMDLDERQPILVNSRLECSFPRVCDQRRGCDSGVQPGLGSFFVPTSGVVVVGVEHGRSIRRRHVDRWVSGQDTGLVVQLFGLASPRQYRERQREVGGDHPPHVGLLVRVDDLERPAAVVDDRWIEPQVQAIPQGCVQRLQAGARRIGSPFEVEWDGAEAP